MSLSNRNIFLTILYTVYNFYHFSQNLARSRMQLKLPLTLDTAILMVLFATRMKMKLVKVFTLRSLRERSSGKTFSTQARYVEKWDRANTYKSYFIRLRKRVNVLRRIFHCHSVDHAHICPDLVLVQLRVRTVAKRHMRSSMFTASFILVSCVKLS